MKHVSILVPENATLASLEGTRGLFAEANDYFTNKHLPLKFDVNLVGITKQTLLGDGQFIINTDSTIYNLKKTDLIIIPSFDGDIKDALDKNNEFIPWILERNANGAEVASLCMGAFLLAQTGLIKHRRCSTHWMAEKTFMELYPDVELVPEKIITDEKGIYSSGGAYSYLNLILYLIEKYAGREIAIYTAKVFAIEINHDSRVPFTAFHGQKDHNDQQVKQAQDFIEDNYHDKISVDQLARMLALGRRNFERRFKKATSNTIIEYMQRVKIEVVKKKLEAGNMNVNELMYEVGYSDKKAFRNIFKKNTGLSPFNYRKIYNNNHGSLN
jgi:transcriptional regulator GlxA family with amidase domain